MELIILDSDFQGIGSIDTFNSFQYNRKYFDYDSFQLDCGVELFSLLDQGSYLFSFNHGLSIIEELDYTRSETNEYSLSIRGRSITSIMDDRVVIGEKKYSGTHEDVARQLVDENFISPADPSRKIKGLVLGNKNNLGTDTTLEMKNKEIGKTLVTFLKEKELGQSICFDYFTNELSYIVYQGLDRTEEQVKNDWAVFSDDYDNISDVNYSKDDSGYKNFAYIIGKDNLTTFVDQVKPNERRKEMITTSSEEVVATLQEKGRQELIKENQVDVINCTAISNPNLQYKRDFDLGDLCTVKIRNLDKMTNMRITEVKEIYENGELTILPKFGEDFITIKKFIEREVLK